MNFTKCFLVLVALFAGGDEGIEELLEQAKSKNATIRGKAILSLGNKLKESQDQENQKSIAITLIDSIDDRTELVSHAARLRIAQYPKIINKYLGPCFQSDEYSAFGKACECIKSIGPEARTWVPELLKRLEKEDRDFKLAALHGLSALDRKDLLPALDQTIAALDHKDFNVQLSACRVLSKLGPDAKKAGPRLVKLLEEGIASARSWAGIALGAIGPHEEYNVVELLAERLDRFYLVDRERALVGLAYLGSDAKSVVPKLEKLMEDRSRSVQHTAARTHWKITGNADTAVERLIRLIPTVEFGTESMDILGEIGPAAKSAVPAMIKQLKSSEFPTREAAVYALASIGPDAKIAIEPLKKLQAEEKDHLIRAAIEIAIEKIETTEEPSQ